MSAEKLPLEGLTFFKELAGVPVYRTTDSKLRVLYTEDMDTSWPSKIGYWCDFDTEAEVMAFISGVSIGTEALNFTVVTMEDWSEGGDESV